MNDFDAFLGQIENTLRFEYYSGDVTTMEPGYTTHWRTLPSIMLAELQGAGSVVTENGCEPYPVSSGDLLCVTPGVRHRIDNLPRGASRSRWAHFNVFILGAVDVTALVKLPRTIVGGRARQLGDLNGELARIHSLAAPALPDLMRKQSLGFRLAELLLEEATHLSNGPVLLPHLERLAPVLTYIHENLSRPLSREELAKLVHLSPSRFYALFKHALGLAPSDYLRDHRLRHAQRLLLGGSLNVRQVAAASGYPDAFHFSRVFRRQFGISPLQYRKTVVKSLGG